MHNLRGDPRYGLQFDGTTTVIALATTSEKIKEDINTSWTYCLGELVKLFFEFCEETTAFATEMVTPADNF